MTCFNCPANNGEDICKAGVRCRMLVSGHYGCSYNSAGVKKHMKENMMTNAKRIRSMSDEELARFLDNGGCMADQCEKTYEEKDCVVCWRYWLQQEVEP